MHAEQDSDRNTLGNKEDFVRRSTFSRTLTFSPETYHRAVVQPLEGLQRTFTEIGNRIDPDAQYTNALIDQYQKNSEGNEGDLPLQTGFARKAKFWKVILLLTVLSSFMGLVAAGFMNATEEVIIITKDLVSANTSSCCCLILDRFPSSTSHVTTNMTVTVETGIPVRNGGLAYREGLDCWWASSVTRPSTRAICLVFSKISTTSMWILSGRRSPSSSPASPSAVVLL